MKIIEVLNSFFYKKPVEISFLSYTSSGATILENILIELGIRLRFEEEINEVGRYDECLHFFKFYKKIDSRYSYYKKSNHLIPSQFGLPSLSKGEDFIFRNDFEVFFSHNSKFFNKNKNTFVMVRDPRDTLLSSFRVFSKYDDPEEFFLFSKLHIDFWIDFYSNAISKKCYIIKFEDIKKSPEIAISRLLLFLGLEYEKKDLMAAIQNSSFETAKKNEDFMANLYPDIAKVYFPYRITKSGKCFQYLLDENRKFNITFSHIHKKSAYLLKLLGYC